MESGIVANSTDTPFSKNSWNLLSPRTPVPSIGLHKGERDAQEQCDGLKTETAQGMANGSCSAPQMRRDCWGRVRDLLLVRSIDPGNHGNLSPFHEIIGRFSGKDSSSPYNLRCMLRFSALS